MIKYTVNALNTYVKHISSQGEEIYKDKSIQLLILKDTESILESSLVKQNYLEYCNEDFLKISNIYSFSFEYSRDNRLVFELSICEPETDNCLFFEISYDTENCALNTIVLDY
jgi:hypothetical protein